MCDYSLMSIPNRLATEGEDLISHRFETGTMGLACQADLEAKTSRTPAIRPKNFWENLKALFATPEEPSVPAVCIPPGARLVLMDIPEPLRNEMQVGRVEEVTFTQTNAAANCYRDAVRFGTVAKSCSNDSTKVSGYAYFH